MIEQGKGGSAPGMQVGKGAAPMASAPVQPPMSQPMATPAGMQTGKGSSGAGGGGTGGGPPPGAGRSSPGSTNTFPGPSGGPPPANAPTMQQQLGQIGQLQSMGSPSSAQYAPSALPPAASQLRPQQAVPFTKEEATRMMSGPVAREPALSIPQQRARSSGAATDIFKMFLPENQSRVSIKRGGSR